MYLSQMPMTWLENVLLSNPGVLTFPGLSSFQDAAVSGVTIPNPNVNNANNANPNLATISVVTRAQILAAFHSLADQLNSAGGVFNNVFQAPGFFQITPSLGGVPVTIPTTESYVNDASRVF